MFDNSQYYGWILISQEEGDATQNKIRFYSSEHATTDRRPYLEIVYDPSPSTSLALADHSSGQVGDKFTNIAPGR
jgi:hypothetical protein